MESFAHAPPSGRIRSFFIKDILEYKRSPAALSESPPQSSIMVDQGTHTVTSPVKTFSVQQLLAINERPPQPQPQPQPDACVSGCCEFSAVYPHKTVATSFYHPYLYSFYRQQAAWRPALRDSVAFVHPQNGMYSQAKQRKARRPWTRAVFSNLQRKGLEKRFQVQKYLTKGDRHQLASMLGLSDNQVKVWFQNRRMKWRQEEQAHEEPASDKAKDGPSNIQTAATSLNNDSLPKE